MSERGSNGNIERNSRTHARKRTSRGGILMAKFAVLAGEVYEVEAENEEEAEKKYWAMLNGDDCPCDDIYCKCLDEIETQTWVRPC